MTAFLRQLATFSPIFLLGGVLLAQEPAWSDAEFRTFAASCGVSDTSTSKARNFARYNHEKVWKKYAELPDVACTDFCETASTWSDTAGNTRVVVTGYGSQSGDWSSQITACYDATGRLDKIVDEYRTFDGSYRRVRRVTYDHVGNARILTDDFFSLDTGKAEPRPEESKVDDVPVAKFGLYKNIGSLPFAKLMREK